MNDDNRVGWYALYLSITQSISPAKALAAMEGRRRGIRRLSWEDFVRLYHENEEKLRLMQRKRNRSDKTRAYQRAYRRAHPLNEEQKKRRAAYLRKYRAAKRAKRTISISGTTSR